MFNLRFAGRYALIFLTLILTTGCGSDSLERTYFSAVIENGTDSTIIVRYDYNCVLLWCDYYEQITLTSGSRNKIQWYEDGDQRLAVPIEVEYNGIIIKKWVHPDDYLGPDYIRINNSDF